MDDRLIVPTPKNYINEFFRKSPNSMAITRARDGKYVEVNETFVKHIGLSRQDMIGQTSVGIGHITAQQRLVLFNEIKKEDMLKTLNWKLE